MSRTVPDVEQDVSRVTLSVHYMDESGAQTTCSVNADPDVTAASMEALVAALAVVTNANIWAISRTQWWGGIASSTGAVSAEQNSVADNVVILYKTLQGDSQDVWLPAPIEGIMNGNLNQPNPASALLITAKDAWEAVLPNAYEPVTMRYSQHKQTNKKVPAG